MLFYIYFLVLDIFPSRAVSVLASASFFLFPDVLQDHYEF